MSFEKLEKILQSDKILFTKDFMERSISDANLYKKKLFPIYGIYLYSIACSNIQLCSCELLRDLNPFRIKNNV